MGTSCPRSGAVARQRSHHDENPAVRRSHPRATVNKIKSDAEAAPKE